MNKRAIVVFLGKDLVDNAAWYSSCLREGFVHCFVLIERQDGWIKIEGQYGSIRLTLLEEFTDVVGHYADQGAVALETSVKHESIYSPLVVRNCVGLVKSILGIRSWAMTPWQLYKYLRGF